MVAAGAGADESQLPDADDGAEDLDTTDPLAYELSAALRGIAALLQLELSGEAGATEGQAAPCGQLLASAPLLAAPGRDGQLLILRVGGSAAPPPQPLCAPL